MRAATTSRFTVTEATRNAASANQLAGCSIVNVYSGGKKKKLKQSVATTDETVPISKPPQTEISRTTIRYANPTVLGLRWIACPAAVTAARAPKAASHDRGRADTRVVKHRSGVRRG